MRAPTTDPAVPGGEPAASADLRTRDGPTRAVAGSTLPSERDDLIKARAGDREALGRLFDRHFDRVHAIAKRIVGRTEVAEDITQEVFLKVRRSLHRIQADDDLAPWIYTVVVHTCRDHLRSSWWRAGLRSVPLEEVTERAASPAQTGDPVDALERAEESRRIHAALQQLPSDQRISVVLHEFEGLSHDRIARITGTSHAAARKRHSRALLALARLLESRST